MVLCGTGAGGFAAVGRSGIRTGLFFDAVAVAGLKADFRRV